MINPITEVCKFNQSAGLLDKPYNDFLESSMQIEEALEGFNLDTLPNQIGGEPKDVSKQLVDTLDFIGLDVDRLDKAINAWILSVGAMAKLKLTPSQIERAILAVNTANLAKLNMSKDEYGKLLKPKDFVGPEPELQKILDER